MKKPFLEKRLWLLYGIAFGLLGAPWANAEEPYRLWTSADGGHQVEAKLSAYNHQQKLLTLIQPDGAELLISPDKISKADVRYLRRFQNRKRLATATSDQIQPAKTHQSPLNRTRNKPQKTFSLYGIQWSPTIKAALTMAEGKPGSKDDKPVLWFRVLGDLKGPM